MDAIKPGSIVQPGNHAHAAVLRHKLHVTCQNLRPKGHRVSYAIAAAVRVQGPGAAQGLSKSGLMGFCDIAPGEAKGLRVMFLWRGQPHAATLLDKVRSRAAQSDASWCRSRGCSQCL